MEEGGGKERVGKGDELPSPVHIFGRVNCVIHCMCTGLLQQA